MLARGFFKIGSQRGISISGLYELGYGLAKPIK